MQFSTKILPNDRFLSQTQGLAPTPLEILELPLKMTYLEGVMCLNPCIFVIKKEEKEKKGGTIMRGV